MGFLESGFKAAALGVRAGYAVAKPPVALTANALWRSKGAAWEAAKLGAKAGRFAFEHPVAVAGAVGVAWGASAFVNRQARSPMLQGIEMKTSVNQQAAASDELTGGTGMLGTGMVGSGSQMQGIYQRNLALSTGGLVQGLYRGRHG